MVAGRRARIGWARLFASPRKDWRIVDLVAGHLARNFHIVWEVCMNTLVAVAIAPFGVGEELSAEVAEVVRVIRESGLKNRTYSMFTEIEGEWDEVMKVVKDATFVLAEKGIRTEVVLKADIRPGYEGMMDAKVAKVNDLIGEPEE